MNFATSLLINVAVVGAGLFVYDQLRAAPQPSDHSTVSIASQEQPVRASSAYEPGLLGGSEVSRLAQLQAAVAKQQQTITALEERLVTWAREAVNRPPLAGINDKKAGSPFSESTLLSLQAYMNELSRRRKEAHNNNRITKALREIGVDLREQPERQAVINETISYQKKTRELMYSPLFARTEEGEQDRARAFEEVRKLYESSVRKLLPARDASILVESKLGQTAGLYKRRSYKK